MTSKTINITPDMVGKTYRLELVEVTSVAKAAIQPPWETSGIICQYRRDGGLETPAGEFHSSWSTEVGNHTLLEVRTSFAPSIPDNGSLQWVHMPSGNRNHSQIWLKPTDDNPMGDWMASSVDYCIKQGLKYGFVWEMSFSELPDNAWINLFQMQGRVKPNQIKDVIALFKDNSSHRVYLHAYKDFPDNLRTPADRRPALELNKTIQFAIRFEGNRVESWHRSGDEHDWISMGDALDGPFGANQPISADNYLSIAWGPYSNGDCEARYDRLAIHAIA